MKSCLGSQTTLSNKFPSHFLDPIGQIDFLSEFPSSISGGISSETDKSHHNSVQDDNWGKLTALDDLETQKNGISDYSYPLEHCNALGEPKSLPIVIKFDLLANNKVILIIDQEI